MKITLLTGKIYNIQDAFDFPLKVIKSVQAKRLTLRIDSKNRQALLSIPPRCTQKQAINFVSEHQEWIIENLKNLPSKKRFISGQNISLFGQEILIRHAPEKRWGARIENGILYVSGESDFTHRRVKDFIKKQAQKTFFELSQKLAKKINCQINDVVIKDTKSRWGSCSSLNNINYNWRLALAPQGVIDYIVAHEVSHLAHQDHSADFWQCVADLCPHYKQGQNWLKQHGKELYAYE
ncbi:MAG: M48 family metallopeptidase [Alphaproteobacteria bacterium]|nr:M48 family metallopeptidase [Alphaproteobacteria bacterium]MBQ8678093.1 M48 family metallopeptidase [Alphaproteobacteria bacterium]